MDNLALFQILDKDNKNEGHLNLSPPWEDRQAHIVYRDNWDVQS